MHKHDDEGNVVSDYLPPTPIFWSLVKEYRKAGHNLPWYQSFKPSGTISILPSTTTGIMPVFGNYYKRQVSTMVCKPNCPLCTEFN